MSNEGNFTRFLKLLLSIIHFILDIPKLIAEDCSASDSSDEEKWEEIDEEVEEIKCLFSDKVFSSIEDALKHLKSNYDFDLAEMKQKYSMDFYSYIKVRPLEELPLANLIKKSF